LRIRSRCGIEWGGPACANTQPVTNPLEDGPVDKDYKATPELWERAEQFGRNPVDMVNLFLELRARVEALEEAENDRRFEQAKAIIDKPAPAPAGLLVERVGAAILKQFESNAGNEAEARAAIREVAAWLRAREVHVRGSVVIAGDLEQEADRG